LCFRLLFLFPLAYLSIASNIYVTIDRYITNESNKDTMSLTKEQLEEHLVHYNTSLKQAIQQGNDVLAAELRAHIKLLSLQYMDLGE
jgi:hypothetical protein